MIEDEHLKYLIHEEIFVVEEKTYPEILAKEPLQAKEPIESDKPGDEPFFEVAVWTDQLTPEDKELLTKMLAAIQIDFATINLMEGPQAYTANYQKILCFGYQEALESKTSDQFTLYQPKDTKNRKFLCAPAITTLHGNNEEKRKLWNGLQKMFLRSQK